MTTASTPPVPAENPHNGPPPQWPGDTGTLPLEVRRTIARLLRGPYLSHRKDPNLWPVLLVHEDVIRSRLADLLLDLLVDADAEVAFCRNADVGDEVSVPKMLRRSSLSFLDTALLLHLREQLLRGEATDERVVLGYPALHAHLSGFAPHEGTDPKKFDERLRASIERMKKWSILVTTDTEDRWEISKILRLLVGPETIAQIEEEYRAILEGREPLRPDGADEPDEPDEPETADEDETDEADGTAGSLWLTDGEEEQ